MHQLGGRKRSFQLRPFATPDWNKMLSMEKGVKNCNHSPTRIPNLVNFGPQTAKMGPFINPFKINFFWRSYLRGKGALPLKFRNSEGIKCPHLILGSFSPKILGTKNVVCNYAILRLYCKYLQNGTRFRWLENGVANCDHSRACLLNLINFFPQTAKMGSFFNPLKINFFGRSYLRGKWWPAMGLSPAIF